MNGFPLGFKATQRAVVGSIEPVTFRLDKTGDVYDMLKAAVVSEIHVKFHANVAVMHNTMFGKLSSTFVVEGNTLTETAITETGKTMKTVMEFSESQVKMVSFGK